MKGQHVIRNGVWHVADCFDAMATIPDGSVDMVLCDLPYGTTQNKWDSVLPLDRLWAEYWRVCKPNAAVVLTAQPPFDKVLGFSCIEHIAYEWVWQKTKPTGFLNAKIQPLKDHENILVFYRKQPKYNPQGTKTVSVNNARKNKSGQGNYGGVEFKPYTQTVGNYPRSVLQFQHETKPVHPTQKPVALFEYLIRTYTNEGYTVLDNTAGSGTTAVAAENTGRRWICIERDEEYSAKAMNRISSIIL